MKNLLKKIKLNRKNAPTTVETISYQNRLHEQALMWKAHAGTGYFTI